jgi:hypothetical protein
MFLYRPVLSCVASTVSGHFKFKCVCINDRSQRFTEFNKCSVGLEQKSGPFMVQYRMKVTVTEICMVE